MSENALYPDFAESCSCLSSRVRVAGANQNVRELLSPAKYSRVKYVILHEKLFCVTKIAETSHFIIWNDL